MQALAALPELTFLEIHSTGFSCAPHFLGENAFSKLQSLELYTPAHPHSEHDFFAAMRHVTALKESRADISRNACNCKVADRQRWGFCRDMARLTAMKSLDINLCDLNSTSLSEQDSCTAALQHCLSSMPGLQDLNCFVHSSQLPCTWSKLDWECCSSLSVLDIKFKHSDLSDGSVGVTVLAKVAGMHQLRAVDVGLPGDDENVGSMFCLPLPPHLTHLSVSCTGNQRMDGEVMANSLSLLSSLRSLEIDIGSLCTSCEGLCLAVTHLTALTKLLSVPEPTMGAVSISISDKNCRIVVSTVCCLSGLQTLVLILRFDTQQHTICGAMTGLESLSSF